ncbi:hypothetical protein DQ04_13101010 [Trypanosoma grayi]|uniref:hypothetical protein n=1 Tax=Trypanosoma grayi TaxID=71804 RepID=UPI0004F47F69|nr:hypothetical protein DQ04_13101010 [Trypanosoma grayi]KEG06605.1 hypothetical protein DQ04_13101010 [Trypanosoma grayi]
METEGLVAREHLDTVSHHTRLVQRRLPVKHHAVTIKNVTVDDQRNTALRHGKVLCRVLPSRLLRHIEVDEANLAVGVSYFEVRGTGVAMQAIDDASLQKIHACRRKARHLLRERQTAGERAGQQHLVWLHQWVR